MSPIFIYILPVVQFLVGLEGDPDFSGIVTALQSAITPAQLLGYLAQIVGVALPLYVVWALTRKATGWFKGAIRGR